MLWQSHFLSASWKGTGSLHCSEVHKTNVIFRIDHILVVRQHSEAPVLADPGEGGRMGEVFTIFETSDFRGEKVHDTFISGVPQECLH